MVQGDLLIGDLTILGRSRLLDLFDCVNDRQELDTGECLQLLVTTLKFFSVEFELNDIKDFPDLGKGFVRTEIRHQETLPAWGCLVGVSDTIFVHLGLFVYLGQSNSPGANLAPIFKDLKLPMNQFHLPVMPLVDLSGTAYNVLGFDQPDQGEEQGYSGV